MKKLLAIILLIAILLVGCGNGTTATTENTEEKPAETEVTTEPVADPVEEIEVPTTDVINIGIVQLVQHGALDDTREGFIAGLAEAGYVDGENIHIDYQNAQGEIGNTNTIGAKFVNDKKDIILAIATPAAQSIANATQDIPVLFSAVTDAVDAGLVDSNEAPGGNITGTSDLGPIAEQIDLLKKFVPDAKVVGVLFCSNEANSHVQAAEAKIAIEALGMEYKEYTVSETNQIQQVVQTAVGQVDALFSSTDNMIAAAMPQVSAIAIENNIPIIVGEQGQVDSGALATYGVNYFSLGKQTAKQAVEIINGKSPSEIPVQFSEKFDLVINEETLKALGLTKPEGLD